MSKKLMRWAALLGVLIFAFFVYKIGPDVIWENVKKITWYNFLILCFLRFVYWLLRTINWKVILDQYGGKSTLWHLFAVRMASFSISQLTPSAQVGGEAARVMMVKGADKRVTLASVIVDKTIEFITMVFFTIIAVAIAVTRIALPAKIKYTFIGFTVVASILLIFVIYRQKRGLFGGIVNLLAKCRIKPKFLERHKDKIKETDNHIADFYSRNPKNFIKLSLLYTLLMLVWTTEIHLTMVFIGAKNAAFIDSFLITALGNLAFVFPFMPASLGIYEATYVALFSILRIGAGIGFTLVLIRRILALLGAGLGLLGMVRRSDRKAEPTGTG